MTSKTDDYWKERIGFHNSLADRNKEILMRIIEPTMIDTISNTLGVIDGSSTLKDCSFEPELLLDLLILKENCKIRSLEGRYSNN